MARKLTTLKSVRQLMADICRQKMVETIQVGEAATLTQFAAFILPSNPFPFFKPVLKSKPTDGLDYQPNYLAFGSKRLNANTSIKEKRPVMKLTSLRTNMVRSI